MNTPPLISVLLPVRDGAAYLDEALESVIGQSCGDFEVIAVDDGSVDETPRLLQAWSERDDRLRLITLNGVGPAGALNAAIDIARGEFFARMDADDISMPTRFQEQLSFLRQHPDVGVCGSWVKPFGAGWERTLRYVSSDARIRAKLMFESPFAHPSTMIRRSVLERLPVAYREDVARAEDYDLWVRLSRVCELGNLERVLLRYRRHAMQVTVKNRASSVDGAERVRASLLAEWWPESTGEERRFHHQLCSNLLPASPEKLEEVERWLLRISERNRRHPFVSQDALRESLALKWCEVCRHFSVLGLGMLARFVRSPLAHFISIQPHRLARLLASGVIMETTRWRARG